MKLSRYEQETIINFNAGSDTATLYTRDRAVMKRLDTLVVDDPTHYRFIGGTDIDRTYEMPKAFVSYRKTRHLTQEQREAARCRMMKINRS